MIQEGSLIILSGGKSSRMGKNKALLEVEKETILQRILNELGPLFKETILVTNTPADYKSLAAVRVVTDIIPHKGPLSGIHSGLVHASYQRGLVVACDMPFVSAALAIRLFEQSNGWDVTVPVEDGKFQPLFAVYSKDCIEHILQQLESNNLKITSFYNNVKVNKVDLQKIVQDISLNKVFYNVNTPPELEEARRMAGQDAAKRLVQAWRCKEGRCNPIDDPLAEEKPLTINLNGQEMVTLLCSPEGMDELAVGFLASEGLIKPADKDMQIRLDESQGIAHVTGTTSYIAEHTFLKRYITTGCGKGTTFYNVLDAQCKPVESDLQVPGANISRLMSEVQQVSQLFKETGGVHLTALCTPDEVLFYREDIGRHNALDKIVGRCFMDGILITDKMLFTTGRLSSEIVLKVAKLGVPVLVSRSAPTVLAVELAGQLGITLIGFCRAGRFNIYANEHRIIGGVAQ